MRMCMYMSWEYYNFGRKDAKGWPLYISFVGTKFSSYLLFCLRCYFCLFISKCECGKINEMNSGQPHHGFTKTFWPLPMTHLIVRYDPNLWASFMVRKLFSTEALFLPPILGFIFFFFNNRTPMLFIPCSFHIRMLLFVLFFFI